ncbi:MAG: hypothetical protein JW871_05945 [Endomicrobiales bacterium]|nr:hypothetical protein [Endomicrobiales bacterium]
MKLENKTAHRGYTMDIGGGIADMLVTKFVESKKFKVIERSELELVMKEQKLGLTGVITPQTAAQIGKILGVEYMVIGTVNEYGTKSSDVGAFGVGVKSHSAVVGLDIRVIDTSTAEIVSAATGEGKKSSKGLKLSNSDIFPTDVKMGSNKFNSSLIGKATREAVDKAAKKVIDDLGGQWKGSIIKISNGTVFLNAGKNVGIKKGDEFKVIRKGEEMIDPETGESLGSEDEVIGEIKITEVKEKFSKAKIISGDALKGDTVERK